MDFIAIDVIPSHGYAEMDVTAGEKTLTVRELMAMLAKCNPDANVIYAYGYKNGRVVDVR